jgi:hypothetical protein
MPNVTVEELQIAWKEAVMAQFRHYPGIYVQREIEDILGTP